MNCSGTDTATLRDTDTATLRDTDTATLGDKITILAVDDDHDLLRLLSDTLTGQGYLVQVADSGEMALASIVANPPELIHERGLVNFQYCEAHI